MREIKFRAWNIKTNELILEGFRIIGECTVFGMLDQYLIEHDHDLMSLNDILIEQFTGLQDKNKKDIYENDRVREDIGIISTILFDEINARFVFRDWHGNDNELSIAIADDLEVIGTTHDQA